MVTGLSHVFLLVSDLARSVQFYRKLLDRAPTSEDARHAGFELGPISLAVHEDLMPAEALQQTIASNAWPRSFRPASMPWAVELMAPAA